MKLSSQLTKVTPLSKAFAMILFIILPFIAFMLGIKYGKLSLIQDFKYSLEKTELVKVTPTLTLSQPIKKYQDWKIFYNEVYSIQYPANYITSKDFIKTKTPQQNAFLTRYPRADIGQKAEEERQNKYLRFGEEEKMQKDIDVDNQPWEITVYLMDKKDLKKQFTKEFIPQSTENEYLEIPSEEEFFDKNSTFRKSLRTERGNGGVASMTYETVYLSNVRALKEQTIWHRTTSGFKGTWTVYYIFGRGESSSKVIQIHYSTKVGESNALPEKMISSFFLRQNY